MKCCLCVPKYNGFIFTYTNYNCYGTLALNEKIFKFRMNKQLAKSLTVGQTPYLLRKKKPESSNLFMPEPAKNERAHFVMLCETFGSNVRENVSYLNQIL